MRALSSMPKNLQASRPWYLRIFTEWISGIGTGFGSSLWEVFLARPSLELALVSQVVDDIEDTSLTRSRCQSMTFFWVLRIKIVHLGIAIVSPVFVAHIKRNLARSQKKLLGKCKFQAQSLRNSGKSQSSLPIICQEYHLNADRLRSAFYGLRRASRKFMKI